MKEAAVTRGYIDQRLSDLPSSADEARAAVEALPNRFNPLLVGNKATETALGRVHRRRARPATD